MNILTEIAAALEAKEEAASALDMLSKPGTSGFDEISWKRAYYRLKRLEDDLHAILTDDNIAALIAVARAAEAAAPFIGGWVGHVEASEMLDAALAPLVKEADCPTCHGLGGGGGFDRNGSHTEERYCEYPCPTCGKEATDEP